MTDEEALEILNNTIYHIAGKIITGPQYHTSINPKYIWVNGLCNLEGHFTPHELRAVLHFHPRIIK